MAGFITARDGIYTVLQTITGSTSGFLKIGYKFERREQTDATGEGYPYYTVSPATDKNTLAYLGTVNTWSTYTIIVRIFSRYLHTEANETAFLTMLDLVLTTLMRNSNINLNGTVQAAEVANAKMGYNDATQPTLRIAEIECIVKQRHDRNL